MIPSAESSPEELAAQLSPELVRVFEESVAIKMWPNGDPMTEPQIETVVAALLLRQALVAPSDDPFSIDTSGALVLGKGRRLSPNETDNKANESSQQVKIVSDRPRK